MNTKNDISRVTIDMPVNDHKKLKAIAAVSGKTMREMVLEFIDHGLSHYQQEIKECSLGHTPNKQTAQTIRDSKKNKIEAKNAQDLFKKLGI